MVNRWEDRTDLKHWVRGRKSQQILGPLLLFVDGLSEERIRNQWRRVGSSLSLWTLSAVALQLPQVWHAVLNLPKAVLFKSLDVTFSDFLSSKIHPSFYSYTILIWPLHSLGVNELVWLLTIPKWTFSNQEKHPNSQYNVKLYTTVEHKLFLLPTR